MYIATSDSLHYSKGTTESHKLFKAQQTRTI